MTHLSLFDESAPQIGGSTLISLWKQIMSLLLLPVFNGACERLIPPIAPLTNQELHSSCPTNFRNISGFLP